jgi:hypothetical protein
MLVIATSSHSQKVFLIIGVKMRMVSKKMVGVELGGQLFSVDSRIWSLFETKASDKKYH